MLNFLRYFHERPYNSGQVKLALNFLLDSQNLLGMESSSNLSMDEFRKHLHDITIKEGITDPLVLKYVRNRFAEFDEITSVCDTLVAKIVEYGGADGARGWWAGRAEVLCKDSYIREVTTGRYAPPKYLANFLSLADIVSGLHGTCLWLTEPNESILSPAIKAATPR